MKRVIITLAVIVCFCGLLPAAELDLGFMYGLRTMSDSVINTAYGSGGVFFPYADIKVMKGLALGAGYEGGYSKDGTIGIFEDAATLKVSGFELFAAYQFDLNKIKPYVKAGVGFYTYKQTVTGVSTAIDDSATGLVLAGGARFYPSKGWFISGEVKYVPLTVTPLEEDVDLGGLRLSLGLGYSFEL